MVVYMYHERFEQNGLVENDFVQIFESKERALSHWKSVMSVLWDDEFDPEDENLIIDYEADFEWKPDDGFAWYSFDHDGYRAVWSVEEKVVC